MKRSTLPHLLMYLFSIATIFSVIAVVSIILNIPLLFSPVLEPIFIGLGVIGELLSQIFLIITISLLVIIGFRYWNNKLVSKDHLFMVIVCFAITLTSSFHLHQNLSIITKPAYDYMQQHLYHIKP